MALISFINKKTYEIKDELEDYIYCDYEIRHVIADLNKKGYKTNFSCAGHNEVGLMWPIHKLPIAEMDEYIENAKHDMSLHFVKKTDEYFYHKDEKVSTYIYISFDKNYNFDSYPKDFDYELFDGHSLLTKEICFYKDDNNTIRKTDEEINKELDISRKELQDWVDNLKKYI